MKCRFCGSKTLHLWAKQSKEYYQCSDCLFVSVDPLPTVIDLDKHYAQYHDLNHQESFEKNQLREKSYKQEVEWMKSFIDFNRNKVDFKILDFGASGGYFLDVIKDSVAEGVSLYGDDKSLPAIAKLKEKGYYFDLDKSDPGIKFDLVILRGVIEHVPDFKDLFHKLIGLLKEDGRIFISATPNGTSTAAQLYRHNWVQHHYPSHIQHFSLHHFDYLLAKYGLNRVDSTDLYYDSIYKKFDDYNIFSNTINKLGVNFSNCKNRDLMPDLRHAFFGSMLTVLYQKKI